MIGTSIPPAAVSAAPGTDLERLPQCPQGHGQMVLRNPPGGYTAEQRWCGIWYDCPPGQFRCRSSVLLPSPALRALAAAATQKP